jgi:peptidoglycan/LPS O-acetylase OafA/YrhL
MPAVPAPVRSRYFPLLDGLRGVAAAVVVLLHATMALDLNQLVTPHAHLAVDFFFALSGFVIANAYERKLEAGMGWKDFMVKRVIRLYPMILVGLAVGVLVFVLRIVVQHRADLWGPLVASTVLNALLLPTSLLLVAGNSAGWPINNPQWSLSFEMLANLAYGMGLYRLRGRAMAAFLAVGAAAIIAVALETNRIDGGNGQGVDLLIGLARVTYPFAVGAAAHQVWQARHARDTDGRPGPGIAIATSVALVVAFTIHVPPAWNGAYEAAFVLVAVPVIVYVAALPDDAAPGRRLFLWLGRLSYPLYATHYGIIKIGGFAMKHRNLGPSTEVAIVFAEIVASVFVALALLKYVDEPVRAWLGARFPGKRPVAARAIAG